MPAQAARKKDIKITVITTADDLQESFNEHQPLRVLFERALTLVGGHGQADQFSLAYSDVELTDIDRPISEFAMQHGWGDEVELELVPKPVVV